VKEMMNLRMYFLNRKCKFSSVSFEDEKLYQNLQSGDVVYFDPPYIPISETASFTNYATEGFNHNQQIKLAELAKSLANRNVRVIISNHDVPIARELYKDAQIHSIQVSRTISAKGSSRKKANELIAVF
jgi:DNA adenine methylase